MSSVLEVLCIVNSIEGASVVTVDYTYYFCWNATTLHIDLHVNISILNGKIITLIQHTTMTKTTTVIGFTSQFATLLFNSFFVYNKLYPSTTHYHQFLLNS